MQRARRRRTGGRSARTGGGSERGSAAIELVLITPVLIALVFAVIQTALVWNARHTVAAAAQHGARLARTATALSPAITYSASAGSTSSDEQIRSSTLTYLRSTGGASLTGQTVTIEHDGSYIIVTVSGSTIGVLPGTTVRVSGSSRTPVEGFRPDTPIVSGPGTGASHGSPFGAAP